METVTATPSATMMRQALDGEESVLPAGQRRRGKACKFYGTGAGRSILFSFLAPWWFWTSLLLSVVVVVTEGSCDWWVGALEGRASNGRRTCETAVRPGGGAFEGVVV